MTAAVVTFYCVPGIILVRSFDRFPKGMASTPLWRAFWVATVFWTALGATGYYVRQLP